MYKNELISVIIPVYGVENYLQKCIKSILNQTYQELELLVVNDGSIDNSKMEVFNLVNEDCDFRNNIVSNDGCFTTKVEFICNERIKCYAFLSFPSENIKDYYNYLDYFANEIISQNYQLGKSKNYCISETGNIEEKECDVKEVEIADIVSINVKEHSYSISSQKTRIVYIEHCQNFGLFQARLTGYEYASGDYIISVDSDDYIGIDYIRLLWKKAKETDADVVVSEMIRKKDNSYYKRTHGMNAIRQLDLYGKDIADNLFSCEGELSPLWFVWGKLYKKKLWDKCNCYLARVEGKHIMLEDLMYGVVFSTNAEHYVYCDVDTYFYVVNENASTTNNGNNEKLSQNLNDVLYAFDFIENYLKDIASYDKYEKQFARFKDKWSRTWYKIVDGYELKDCEKENYYEELKKLAIDGELKRPTARDIYFYNACTPWDSRIECLKEKFCKKEVICFDIFDTAIMRPFWKPADLFVLLNKVFKNLCDDYGVLFSEMRMTAEISARNKISNESSQFEDITIEEIYNELYEIYEIPETVKSRMLEEEIRLELELCQPRLKIRELYDLACWLGKKTLFISDMYLSKDTIFRMLKKCGYNPMNNDIYVSSEIRLCKRTGHLFQYVLNKENIDATNCIHLGDNWESDGEPAKNLGIEVWRTAKTTDLLLNNVSDIKGGKVRSSICDVLFKNKQSLLRYTQALDYFGIRCMLAIIANKIFDNPYHDWEYYSDFNRDPYNIGYMALGMHEYGIIKWLLDKCPKGNKIHFVARDGYLSMKIYEQFKSRDDSLPDYNYFYMSRKSFLPLSIISKEDWWNMKDNINYKGKTPEELLSYYQSILPDYNAEQFRKIFNDNSNIIWDMPLENYNQYISFIRVVINNIHNQSIVDEYRLKMKAYISNIISPRDIMFDIGYSGRAQKIISQLLGYSVDACYIHTLNDKSDRFSKESGFNIHTYYDYSPAITGKIRELVHSEPTSSCIGYEIKDKEVFPVFENNEFRFHEKYVIDSMHNGAVDFVNDFLEVFENYTDIMTYRKTDISFANEKFIQMPTKSDMEIFELFNFEDDLFFNKAYKTKKLKDIWNGDLAWNNMSVISFEKKNEITRETKKEKNVGDNKQKQYPVPYRLVLNPPKGIIKKINYFLSNDHILLKRYMESKSNISNAIFSFLYVFLLNIKNTAKGKNKVGNDKLKYSLSKDGKILYNATSSYGLLCCIVHKLTFYRNESADLMLSTWRKDKYEKVKVSHIFENVILWSDMKYRDMSYAMDALVKDATPMEIEEQEYRFFTYYESLLNIKITDYREIIIAGNSMPFGCFLERNGINYKIIEDGAGLYCDYSLLQHFIDSTYPLIEQYMIKKYKNLQGGSFCEKIYINKQAQKKEVLEKRVAEFSPVELIDNLSIVDKKKIFSIYGVNEKKTENTKSALLLLTYPLAQREKFSVLEERCCYAYLADIFGEKYEEVYLKAHPDDRTNFGDIEGIKVINRNVLSELLWYETKTIFCKAIATVSTSMNNLLCIKEGVAFDTTFCNEYHNLLIYYSIAKVIQEYERACGEQIVIQGIGIYNEMFSEMLNSLCQKVQFNVNSTCYYNIAVYDMDDDINSKDGTIRFSIQKPECEENYKCILLKKFKKRNYDFINLKSECFYVSKNAPFHFPININMDISGIKIILTEKE